MLLLETPTMRDQPIAIVALAFWITLVVVFGLLLAV